MKLYKLLFAVSLSVIFLSCKKDDVTITSTNSVEAKTFLNVAYGNDPKQTYDAYLPANRRADSTKAMILIHGGAWVGGDKTDLNDFVDSLKRRLPDYAFFNVNYRLSTGDTINKFPTQEFDIHTVVNHIYAKAADYQVSQKIVLTGASAGGHLAMLQAYKDTIPVKVKAVVSYFGPSNLLEMYNQPANNNPALSVLLAAAIGKTPTQNLAIYTSSSPINFINSNSSPTILLHGGLDPLVRVSQSTTVRDKLTLFAVKNDYVFYPTAGHGDWNAATYSDSFDKVQAFLKANVR